jgi:hypothetical protein
MVAGAPYFPSMHINPNTQKRYAIVLGARTEQEVAAYLPDNYRVIYAGQMPPYGGARYEILGVVISGRDAAGWTLDDYVAKRLASGLMGCEEIDLSHPVMKKIPVNA